jgi:S-adenosylmethionine-diacylglycerol 3-amino-3-carboxypropyl transferase
LAIGAPPSGVCTGLRRRPENVRKLALPVEDELLTSSQVWDDYAVLDRALRISSGDQVLSVCGAGCNVLSLLLAEPAGIVAVSPELAETALLELKLAALARLSHPEFAAFLGARGADDRQATYDGLRSDLSAEARAYWDEHPLEIYGGVLASGTLERRIAAFAEQCVGPLVDPVALSAFLGLSDPRRQRDLFERELTPLEPAVRSWFGSQGPAAWLDDRAPVHSGELDPGLAFWRRLVEVATMLPARSNFYLEWLLTGRYRSLSSGPPQLRPSNFARLRALAERVTIVTAELSDFLATQPTACFDAANLSGVVEQPSRACPATLLTLVASRLKPGGRLAYWNLPDTRGGRPAEGTQEVRGLGPELFLEDRVPFKRSFAVAETLSAELFSLT